MTATTAATPPAARGGIFAFTGRQWAILLVIQLANVLFGMTITIANLVLPQMRGAMSATQDEISWVITLNLVAAAIATPTTGWLAARLGWRNLMFFTVAGFTVASLLCGLANSLDTLILARIAQGAFGAPIMPLGQAIVLATFPPHLQPTAMAMWGVGSVFGPVLGPILGSLAAEAWNWRAAFFIIVPCGMVTMVCTWLALSQHTERKDVSLDWIGFLALSTAIVAAQLVLDRGQRLDWFESQEIVIWTCLGALALWVFVAHCLTAAQPFLDLKLLLDRNFAVGTVIVFVMGMLLFTGLVLMPTLLHDLRGYPDDVLGTLIASRGLGNWTAFLFIAKLTSVAPRFAIALGMGLQGISALWLAHVGIDLTDAQVFWTNYLQGLGQSVAFTPITVMAFATLPRQHVTEASGLFTLMRNFGSSLFISLSVLVLIRTGTVNYAEMTELVTQYRVAAMSPALPETWSLDTTTGLMRLSRELQRQATMVGYANAFYMMGLTALVAMPLAWLMRMPEPRNT